MHGDTKLLIMKLSELANYCINLEKLLEEDVKQFKKNNIQEIIKNNENELIEIEKITGILNIEIDAKIHSADLQRMIKLQEQSADAHHKKEIRELLDTIHNKANKCLNIITSNNQILFNNLHQLKNLFDCVLKMHSTDTGTYDKSGKINSEQNK